MAVSSAVVYLENFVEGTQAPSHATSTVTVRPGCGLQSEALSGMSRTAECSALPAELTRLLQTIQGLDERSVGAVPADSAT